MTDHDLPGTEMVKFKETLFIVAYLLADTII